MLTLFNKFYNINVDLKNEYQTKGTKIVLKMSTEEKFYFEIRSK